MCPDDAPEPVSRSNAPGSPEPSSEAPPPNTTWGRLWNVTEQLAKQVDCITEILDGSIDSLASDALGDALLKFHALDNRLNEAFDEFADRFNGTPGFKAAQEELWAAPEPRQAKKKPPPPPPKKRGRPRKNPVGAG